MASVTSPGAWPRIMGPQLPMQSMYSLPSMSHRRLPLARLTKTGLPPTERKARTGLFTPPGMTRQASAKARPDWV